MSEITETISFEINNKEFGSTLTLFENAIALYIYEEKPLLGTLGVSVPGSSIMPASTLSITGLKNEHYVKMLGERLATKLQKMVIVSLNIKELNNELMVQLIQRLESIYFDKEEKNKI